MAANYGTRGSDIESFSNDDASGGEVSDRYSSSEFEGFHTDDLSVFFEISSSDYESQSEDEHDQQQQTWSKILKSADVSNCSTTPGPRLPRTFDKDNSSTGDYFRLFLQNEIYELISEETNKYAELKPMEKNKTDKYWYPTCPEEIKAYLGLCILMGINPRREYSDYWSDEPFLGCEGYKKIITVNRYEKITEYLHLNCAGARVRRDDPNYHPLNKVRPIVDMALKNFKTLYRHSTEVSIDEAMKRFKGRSELRQYMPKKPDKWGIKFWCRCDGNTGYMSMFNLYAGRRDTNALQKEHGLGYRVIHDLTRDFVGLNHHIYMDRFFASIHLTEKLLDEKIYTCSTMMSNRKQFPPDLKMPKSALKKLIPMRGDSVTYQKGKTCVTVWNDSNLVTMIYNNIPDPSRTTTCERQVGKEKKTISQPQAISSYNKHMNGVDVHDQLRKKYQAGRSSKKFWKFILWFVIDCCRVNAWLLFKLSPGNRQVTKKRFTQKDFVLELGKCLIGNFCGRKSVNKGDHSLPVLHCIVPHARTVLPGPKRRCKGCYSRYNKRRRETCYGCSVCNVHYCEDCFRELHQTES